MPANAGNKNISESRLRSEEKRQMPKKTDKTTINGLDFDKWIEETSTVEPIADDNLLKYEKKLVAFLDLLGITGEIKSKVNGTENEIISKMSKIKGIVEIEINEAPMNEKMSMLYISDSFIFVCDEEALPCFLQVLSNIQMRILVECKTMLRGALEYGDVIVQDNGKQIIGPAYIDAYLKQEHDAIFPRIIVGNSVLEIINLQFEQYDKMVISQDREFSLDYIDAYMTSESKSKSDITMRLRREGIFNYLRDEYKKHNKENNSSIRAKYAWTINCLKEKGVWPDAKQYNCW
jgi:hypothetical protein